MNDIDYKTENQILHIALMYAVFDLLKETGKSDNDLYKVVGEYIDHVRKVLSVNKVYEEQESKNYNPHIKGFCSGNESCATCKYRGKGFDVLPCKYCHTGHSSDDCYYEEELKNDGDSL